MAVKFAFPALTRFQKAVVLLILLAIAGAAIYFSVDALIKFINGLGKNNTETGSTTINECPFPECYCCKDSLGNRFYDCNSDCSSRSGSVADTECDPTNSNNLCVQR